MSGWSFADVWETVAECLPESTAVVQGNRRLAWRAFDRRANGVAAALLEFGLGAQDKVAHYLFNCPEYLESTLAIFKAGLVPVNTNYRYRGEEVVYLWKNADAAAVIFHGSFQSQIEEIRDRLPEIRGWLWVDDGSGPCPPWALPYEGAAVPRDRFSAPWGRSPDDLILLYTGGTTGMPKGVMWRQEDVFDFLNRQSYRRYAKSEGLDGVRADLRRGPGLVHVAPPPLMHATGGWSSYAALSNGGTVVLLSGRRFDAVELLDTIARERVNTMNFVGEAFARPILDALEAHPGRWDLSSLVRIASTGTALRATTKEGLLRHLPDHVVFSEGLSSSEAASMGRARAVRGEAQTVGRFSLHEGVRVITDDGRDVTPGSGEPGLVAVSNFLPLGYYKDPERTAQVFRVVDEKRYLISGDYATVEADGTIRFVGRGSVCINTGGEKVYPEEVEDVLKQHPAVEDAAVVGVPDDRFGEAVCALVHLQPGAEASAADLVAHVKVTLAGYKAPRHLFFVDAVSRLPNGKPDYPMLRHEAERALTGEWRSG